MLVQYLADPPLYRLCAVDDHYNCTFVNGVRSFLPLFYKVFLSFARGGGGGSEELASVNSKLTNSPKTLRY